MELPATNVPGASAHLLILESANSDGSFTPYIITNSDFSAFLQEQLLSGNTNIFTEPNTYNNCVTVNGNETINVLF